MSPELKALLGQLEAHLVSSCPSFVLFSFDSQDSIFRTLEDPPRAPPLRGIRAFTLSHAPLASCFAGLGMNQPLKPTFSDDLSSAPRLLACTELECSVSCWRGQAEIVLAWDELETCCAVEVLSIPYERGDLSVLCARGGLQILCEQEELTMF